jgi:hypothetical protein
MRKITIFVAETGLKTPEKYIFVANLLLGFKTESK